MSKQHRKAIVTDEHRTEARALKQIWDDAKASGRLKSQKEIGIEYEIGNQNAVSQFLHAKVPLSLKAARGFAAALGVVIRDFSPRLAAEADRTAQFATPDEEDFLPIPQVSGFVFGGNGGHTPDYEEVIGQLRFRADFLRECGVTPQNGRIIKVRGNSMFPRIPDGSVVLVKINEKDPVAGGIFAIAHPAFGPIIKRLELREKVWMAESENPDHPPIAIKDANAVIIGKAVWMGTTL